MIRPIQLISKDVGLKIGLLVSLTLSFMIIFFMIAFEILNVSQLSKQGIIFALFLEVLAIGLLTVYVVKLASKLVIGRPLTKLTRVLQQVEKGEMHARVETDSIDEIGILSRRLNKMLVKLSELEKIKIHSDRKLVMAEEELKYKKVLEEKSRIIEDTNNKLKVSVREFSLLSRMSNSISSILDPNELYLLLAEFVSKEFFVNEFALFIADRRRRNLMLMANVGLEEGDGANKYKLSEALLEEIMRKPTPLFISNSSDRYEYLDQNEFILPERCCAFIPILRQDKLLGVMFFSRLAKDGFNPNEKELLATLSVQVAVALENANLYSQAKELTQTDDLTAIYNRRYFYQALTMEVKRSRRFKRPLSLLMIDVDYFKKFNDTYGHLVGDQVLKELASVLSKNIREVDTLARYGGEEFAMILLDTDVDNAYLTAEKLRKLIENHFKHSKIGHELKITISLGVSGMPTDATTIDDLINHADIALYSAKVKGRNQVVVFNKKVKPILKAI